MMRTEDFDYKLPPELIAQRPAKQRAQSRLLVLDRAAGKIEHEAFSALPRYLAEGDALVLNDTRVIKCRLFGTETASGRRVELLLVREAGDGCWEALARPGKRARLGATISLAGGAAQARVVEHMEAGRKLVRMIGDAPVEELMRRVGHVPLPPYIKRADGPDDETRYQTVYAREDGAVAAPTAGLHFSEELLREIEKKDVKTAYVTLHVGPGTFKPVGDSDPTRHVLDPEWFRLAADQAAAVNEARLRGRAFCVGTTVARVMETVARRSEDGARWVATPGEGWTDKYILPPYEFKIVDCLLTNFHLPRTTLLMLVSALAGREPVLSAYEEAVRERYRFYSYGDAMLIL